MSYSSSATTVAIVKAVQYTVAFIDVAVFHAVVTVAVVIGVAVVVAFVVIVAAFDQQINQHLLSQRSLNFRDSGERRKSRKEINQF